MDQPNTAARQKRMVLEPRPIKEFKNLTFRIPFYQRGYRWEPQQVLQLLEDFAESPKDMPYYLQPIVVAPSETDSGPAYDYDIIDGQQRLTTIYLILQALTDAQSLNSAKLSELSATGNVNEIIELAALVSPLKNYDIQPDFAITYETRTSSKDFLTRIADIDESNPAITESPDHLYMWHAYNTIKDWICDSSNRDKVIHIAKIIKDWVKVIWYELPDSVQDWKKFTDLNIGKIPLTNSELIKALFLRSGNFSGENEKQSEEYDKQTLVAQWDQIERELNDNDFWGFLTREDAKKYPTKIDLIFDLISGKSLTDTNDKLYTFYYFVEWFKANPDVTGKNKWNEIYLQYQRLRDWYKDTSIYHLLGYLVAVDYPRNTLQRIFRFAHPVRHGSAKQTVKSFRSNDRIISMLNELVRKSLIIPENEDFINVTSFEDLRYNCAGDPDNNMDNAHHELIKRYLTLYNIRTTEEAGNNLRYPFAMHNSVQGGWSLEHIHAQHSETLNKYKDWKEWLENHKESLERLENSVKFREDVDSGLKKEIADLINEMSAFNKNDTRERFNELAGRLRSIMEKMPEAQGLYQDEMANLALLGKANNSSLNNSTFDVKRQKIINMIGTSYVPIATERVFLKAIYGEYTNKQGETIRYKCDTEHLFFWSHDDRKAYIADMKRKLVKFLPNYNNN